MASSRMTRNIGKSRDRSAAIDSQLADFLQRSAHEPDLAHSDRDFASWHGQYFALKCWRANRPHPAMPRLWQPLSANVKGLVSHTQRLSKVPPHSFGRPEGGDDLRDTMFQCRIRLRRYQVLGGKWNSK